jgi:hypothetical protein
MFVNNTAPKGDGGVAHVHPNGSAVFTSCSFVNNSASAGGGAVDVYKGSARFDNCTFEEDRAGTDLRFNGVYNGGSVVFGCPTGTTGAAVRLYGNANTTQLPPAKQVVSCHPPPAPFKALKVDDSAATTDDPVADPAATFIFGQARFTVLSEALVRLERLPEGILASQGSFDDRASTVVINRRMPPVQPIQVSHPNSSSIVIDTARLRITYHEPGVSNSSNHSGAVCACDPLGCSAGCQQT